MINLTESQEAAIVRDATAALVASLITAHKDEFDYVSPAQVGGLLDLSQAALRNLPITRYVLANGSSVRYKLSEVNTYINSRREG